MPNAVARRTSPCLGILRLDTEFRRFPGDVGNPKTWPFPVLYQTVPGATADRVVAGRGEGLLDAFKDAARTLVDRGADGISTTCGFLSLFQRDLADHCGVPVATSSLLQIPIVNRLMPRGQRVGVLTYDARSLTPEHLGAAGVIDDIPIVGLPRNSAFRRYIRTGDPEITSAMLENEVLAAAERLVRRHPDVGAIVSECTNLPPYSAAIRRCLGIPVFDMASFIAWFYAGLRPKAY